MYDRENARPNPKSVICTVPPMGIAADTGVSVTVMVTDVAAATLLLRVIEGWAVPRFPGSCVMAG